MNHEQRHQNRSARRRRPRRRTILACVEIAAAPERVFRALTSQEITEWWVRPGVFDTREWSGDVHVGGRWRAAGMSRGQPYVQDGEFLEIESPHKLVHTWDGAGTTDMPSTVTYLLEQFDERTRITFGKRASSRATSATRSRQDGRRASTGSPKSWFLASPPIPSKNGWMAGGLSFIRAFGPSTGEALANETAIYCVAKSGDRHAFQQLTEPHRRELQLHSYRMLGSFHDAEDMVQETFLRGVARPSEFRRSRLHPPLVVSHRDQRLPERTGHSRQRPPGIAGNAEENPSTDQMPDREPAYEIPWLEPYPGLGAGRHRGPGGGSDARYETREAVHLAFIATIQLLPPRQRAVLLLHDVLGWSASESARLLDSSAAAVNSALQRARSTLEERLPTKPPSISTTTAEERVLLERYVRAWETTDVDGFIALLQDDTVLSMPPWRQWYQGRHAIGSFFAMTGRAGGHAPFRLAPTAANRQRAFAFYSRWQSPDWRFHSIQLLVLQGNTISRMTSFVMPELASVFGLPAVLPAEAGTALRIPS